MKISVAPAHISKGCDECLQKSVPLFTIQTVVTRIALCEECAKEATIAVSQLGIKARELSITGGQPLRRHAKKPFSNHGKPRPI